MATQAWRGWALTGMVLLASLGASGACRREVPASRAALSAAEVAARGRAATVIVTSGTCRGSGFFVTPTLLLTNAHVLCAETAEARIGERPVPATIVEIDDELDVALLRTEGGSGSPLPLADALGVRDGDQVAAAGFPAVAGEAVTVIAGRVTRPMASFWGVLHIEAELPLSPGNSGGPLLDDRGRVVGIISKRRLLGPRNWALAVPINYVTTWLPAGVGVANRDWDGRVVEAATAGAPDLERFRSALQRPMLLGAHYLPSTLEGAAAARPLLVFVVAAPASVHERVSELTVRLTCGDTRPAPTRLSEWLPIDRPLERTMRLDVTALRPFLAWARKGAHAGGLVLATGDAGAIGEPAECPGRRLTLLEGETISDSIAIE